MKQKVIAIVGPTAVGKSSLGIHLAKKNKGEIISADSRQVYKGMDIGTGKVTKTEQRTVPHHLIDVSSPKKQYTVANFKIDAQKAIKKITSKGQMPIVVGGTAFYVYTLVDDLQIPEIKPNSKLRKELEKKTTPQLLILLKQLDPVRYRTIDKNNRARLIRAIEINKLSGKNVPQLDSRFRTSDVLRENSMNVLFIGIKKDPVEIRKLINKRVDQRIKSGLINELKKLRAGGVSVKRIAQIGLTYAIANQYLQKLISKKEMSDRIKTAEYQFSKRQMTWFKKDPRINWVNSKTAADKLVKKFLSSNS